MDEADRKEEEGKREKITYISIHQLTVYSMPPGRVATESLPETMVLVKFLSPAMVLMLILSPLWVTSRVGLAFSRRAMASAGMPAKGVAVRLLCWSEGRQGRSGQGGYYIVVRD